MLFLITLFAITSATAFLDSKKEVLNEHQKRQTIEEFSLMLQKKMGVTELPQNDLSDQAKAEYLEMLEGHGDSDAMIEEKVITLTANYENNEVSISLLPLYDESVIKVQVMRLVTQMSDSDQQLLLKTIQQAAIDRSEAIKTEFNSPSLPSSFPIEVHARIMTVLSSERTSRSLEDSTSSEHCHMLAHTFKAQDIFKTVILKPEFITIGECSGVCQVGRSSVTQWVEFTKQMGVNDHHACCKSTEQHGIWFVYHNGTTVRQALLPDVIIGACGCNY